MERARRETAIAVARLQRSREEHVAELCLTVGDEPLEAVFGEGEAVEIEAARGAMRLARHHDHARGIGREEIRHEPSGKQKVSEVAHAHGLLDALGGRAPLEAREPGVRDQRVQGRTAERVGAGLNAREVAEVEHARFDPRIRVRSADARSGVVRFRSRAAWHDHGSARCGERPCCFEAYTRIRACHEDALR